MTPAEYVAKIGELVSGGRDEDALQLAARFGPKLTPRLSPEDFFHVAGLLASAELVASSPDTSSNPEPARQPEDHSESAARAVERTRSGSQAKR